MVDGRPALISRDNELFPQSAYRSRAPTRSGRPWWKTFVPDRSVNLSYRRSLEAFFRYLDRGQSADVLVVGAAHQRRALGGFVKRASPARLLYTDIDVAADVDMYCDVHRLPFQDSAFDGVIASAVLEHVVDPALAVSEIHRVLRPNGILYSEIPFLQQVHEGAYDFTRLSLSGHRRLMNHFKELSSGVVAGPGTVLAWALEHFAVSCTPRMLARPMRMASRIAFSWLKYFDYIFGQSAPAVDGASCTFFLGLKAPERESDTSIVRRYSGRGSTSHT
jgi:SAM-dependent methyltransferase